LAGCACLVEQPDRCTKKENPVFEEARVYLLEGDEDLAVEALKEEASNGTDTCTAAFYLFFLDPAGNEYLDTLTRPVCAARHPLNNMIVQKFLAFGRKQEKCTKDRRLLRKKISALAAKLKKVEAERNKLGFELKKLEQIRQETEKLRLNK
jgi:hypothetical protein